jgi:hypothetical protein
MIQREKTKRKTEITAKVRLAGKESKSRVLFSALSCNNGLSKLSYLSVLFNWFARKLLRNSFLQKKGRTKKS